jgi:signal transduction histidine kinase
MPALDETCTAPAPDDDAASSERGLRQDVEASIGPTPGATARPILGLMQRSPDCAPTFEELAPRRFTQPAPTVPVAAFAARWRQTRARIYLACNLAHALFGLLLFSYGYPRWRLAGYGVSLVVAVLLQRWAETPAARAREDAGDSRVRERAELAWLGTMLVEIALTGGVRSPLFPSNLAAIPLNYMQFGRSKQMSLSAGAIAACALAFLLSPPAWTGPTVPPLVYGLTLCAAIFATGGSWAYYWALLKRVAEESQRETLRTREEMVVQERARSRELEQLSAKISHELKNPLSAIKTLVQVSARATQDPESRERLEVVEREVKRMELILRDYLSFSRPLDALSPEQVSLAELVDDVLAVVSGRAGEAGVGLRRRGDAVAEVDRQRLGEALLNLVMNSLEASSAGGLVQIEIGVHDRQACVTVRDSGCGMSDEVLARVGTPFFTTRSGGTGLGVSLARAAFVNHGGRLDYSSVPGEGTTATGLLPLFTPRGSARIEKPGAA